jgi:hypothetical protein
MAYAAAHDLARTVGPSVSSSPESPPAAPAASAAPQGAPGPAPFAVALELLLVAAATALAYSNTFAVPFQFDDNGLLRNPALRALGSLWPPRGARWVGDVTFALNHRLGGWDVAGYHAVNLAVHLANGLLVYALAATTLRTPGGRAAAGPLLRRWLPLAAAATFSLHPLATQAVTYVVQRYASLATLLFLAALVLHVRARLAAGGEVPRRARAAVLHGLSVLAAVGAMRTKEIAFTLPAVALAHELLFLRGPRRRLLLLLPLAATAVLVPLGHVPGPAELGRATAETDAIPRSVYLLTQARVVATYLRLLVLPVGQNLDHDVALSRSILDAGVLPSMGVLAGVCAAAAWALVAARRAGRLPGVLVFFGTTWFFVTLTVESSVIPIRDVMFEHRVYLPAVGASLVFATGLLAAVEALRLPGPPALQCAAALLVTAGPLGVATHARNGVWRDELTLWSDVVAKSPGKARPHNYLGIALAERGAKDEAIAHFRAALRLQPWYADALLNLGNMYRERGDFQGALRLYERAVLVAPKMAAAHNNAGGMYEAAGRREDAVRAYREALRLSPGMPEATANLARLEGGRPSAGPAR